MLLSYRHSGREAGMTANFVIMRIAATINDYPI